MSARAIEVRGLRKHYPAANGERVEALRGIDFDCDRGEVFGLLGANGAGKTTTLRILATILSPSEGTALVDGVDVSRDPLAVRRRLGFLSASTGLYPRLTPRETLRWFGELHGLAGERLATRVEELVDRFALAPFADAHCQTLSTGQKQRVSIARAVLHDPSVLILDEPTSGLDVLAAATMIEFVEDCRARGTCVLLSTHVLSEAERLCDRLAVIDRGRVVGSGTIAELCAATGTRFLIDAFRALVGAGDGERA